MLTSAQKDALLQTGVVPEHSVRFMEAMSGGESFLEEGYLFFQVEDGLICIGYPPEGRYSPEAFESALQGAAERVRPDRCWAICPQVPERLARHCTARDHYYVRPAELPVPKRWERVADRAAARLSVNRTREFTGAHRRLWAEFTTRVRLPDNVRELYARTERVLARAPGLVLLNAWDGEGRLAACMLLDEDPAGFTSYLIGARAFENAVPNAADLLMREMIAGARRRSAPLLHLGLGVNSGIRRFKMKWGARPEMTYEMASWHQPLSRPKGVKGSRDQGEKSCVPHTHRTPVVETGWDTQALETSRLPLLAALPGESTSRSDLFKALPRQRRFAMLWEIEGGGRRSWIGGTAHFFLYSFDFSFRDLFERVDTVLFEGPLDPGSMEQVAAVGNAPDPGTPRVIEHISEEEFRRLERAVCGPRGFWARMLGLEQADPPDVRGLLTGTRPWMAFFTLWSRFLARRGWAQSVDLEAWQIAHEMGKTVHPMESIPEQLETLESIPMARIASFLRSCREWDGYIRRNARAYLKGDVERMFGTSIEFPTRTELVIHRRDARFLDRMRPYLEEGNCVVLVGSAHMINLRGMLADAGYRLRRTRC